MEIIKADKIGFCFGVNNAVKKAIEELEMNHKLYCYGDIIHNKDAINKLADMGMIIIDDLPELKKANDAKVLIRSHGVPKMVIDFLNKYKIDYIDATCPKVKKIHKIVEDYSKDNYNIIIIGDKNHPEVEGIIGWISEDVQYLTANTFSELQQLPLKKGEKYCLVAQTTFFHNIFDKMVEFLDKNSYTSIKVHNTICTATRDRQNSCREVAAISDLMLVIGGKKSSNTKKLYDLCKDKCEQTYLIENYKEIPYEFIKNKKLKVGIAAGASTPDWVIEEVIINVREHK